MTPNFMRSNPETHYSGNPGSGMEHVLTSVFTYLETPHTHSLVVLTLWLDYRRGNTLV